MRTDRELLELAAKAAGMTGLEYTNCFLGDYYDPRDGEIGLSGTDTISIWNPLTDDGDALRLAVKLRISLIHEDERFSGGHVIETIEATGPRKDDFSRNCEMLSLNEEGDDPMRNTRRAIVLAAAEIGASMP